MQHHPSSLQSEGRHTLPRVVVSSDGTCTTTSSCSDVWQGGGSLDPIQLWLEATYTAGNGDDLPALQAMAEAPPSRQVELSFNAQNMSGDNIHDIFPESEATNPEVQNEVLGSVHTLSTAGDSELSSSSALDFLHMPSDLFSVQTTSERKISNVSSVSEPAYHHTQSSVSEPAYQHTESGTTYQHTQSSSTLEEVNRMLQLQMPSFLSGQASPDPGRTSNMDAQKPLHLSLPDLTFDPTAEQNFLPQNMLTVQDNRSGHASPLTNSPSLSRLSLSPLQDIPEGVQMELENPLSFLQMSLDPPDQLHYRESSPSPSSPSVASISSPSLFDPSESPSVIELCELIGESSNVQHGDFSHLTLSDVEKEQLFGAAQTIQSAFRNYKHKSKMKSREKNAALLIENYYKRYKELKKQKDQAARRIQQQYRNYRTRSRELNRAAVFIQQMYRYHRMRTRSPDFDGEK